MADFIKGLMYGRAVRNNPQFASMENRRLEDERERRYLMQDVDTNRAFYEAETGPGGILDPAATAGLSPDEIAARNQQLALKASLYSPIQDTRSSYASNWGGMVNPTDFQRQINMMGSESGRTALNDLYAIRNQGKGTSVEVNPNFAQQMRSAEDEARIADYTAVEDEARAKIGEMVQQGYTARSGLDDVEVALELLGQVKTGFGEEWKTYAMQLGNFLGLEIDQKELAQREALMARLGDEVMARVGETKGAVSEKEMELFKQYSANFGKTNLANRFLLEFKRQKFVRDIDVANRIRMMRRQGLRSSEIDAAIHDYVNGEGELADSIMDELAKTVPGAMTREEWRASRNSK